MKIFISFMIVFLLLLSVGVEIDKGALELQNEAFNRAMITFGIAKSLNALISFIQGTELSLSPAGLGLTLSVGEILDPLNDMVERFSWVMLLASISLGIQKFLLIISGKLFLQTIFVLSGIISLVMIWYKKLHQNIFFTYSLKIFILLVFLRFGAIVFIYFSQFTYGAILENEYKQSLQIVENTKTELESYQHKSTTQVQESDENIFTRIKKHYTSSLESMNISKQLEAIEESSNKAFNNIVVLITIFIVESILLPLLYIWLVINSVKFVFRSELKYDTLKNMYNKNY
ncbi:hypothetical protein [Sulfurimonas microaerophilic]|uniref:hypothetical protein n=1 Tax=Sulfurimonas microaerophilic TaxID=3058392 RepID=UPI002714A11D|nr:hypothetical protein [Sulfurimonas sp. hsl 1-7]